jgi:glutathione S-transferase
MSGLKVYYDSMSQPSRAVLIFLKLNKIPFEDKPVALMSGNQD